MLLFVAGSRLEVGIDPLLRIIRELLPSSFEKSQPNGLDISNEAIHLGKHFKEFEFFSFFLLPNNSISVNI